MRVLSRVFRAKYRDGLRRLFDDGRLVLPDQLREPATFASWLEEQCRRDWVVYAKPPFGVPAQVLKYLARYTHRVAISNNGRFSIPPMGIELGVHESEYFGNPGLWLRGWDRKGNLIPTTEERAEKLAAKLRELGVNPEDV